MYFYIISLSFNRHLPGGRIYWQNMQRSFGLYSQWIWIQHWRLSHKTPGIAFLFSSCLIISSEMTVSTCICSSLWNGEGCENAVCADVYLQNSCNRAAKVKIHNMFSLPPWVYQARIWGHQQHYQLAPVAPRVPLIPALLPSLRTDSLDTLLIVPYESKNFQRLTILKHLRILWSLKDTLEMYHYSRNHAMLRLLLICIMIILFSEGDSKDPSVILL